MQGIRKTSRSFCWLLAGWLSLATGHSTAQESAKPAPAPRVVPAAPPLKAEPVDEATLLARALAQLDQTRAALGKPELWAGLQSLSLRFKVARVVKYASVQGPDKVVEKERKLDGKVEFDYLAQDRFRRKLSTETLGNFKYTYTEIVNGDKAWRDPPMRVRSSKRDARVIDVGDAERTLDIQTQSAQQQISLYALLYLLFTPKAVPLQWRDEGVHQLYDETLGSQPKPVRVLLGVAPENFHPLLLIDPQTQLPAGLALNYVEAVRQSVLVEAAALDRGYMRRTFQRAAQENRARTQPPRRHELRWLLSDFRPVNGLLIPHLITTTRDGVLLEQLVVTEAAINRGINPKRFIGEPKVNY